MKETIKEMDGSKEKNNIKIKDLVQTFNEDYKPKQNTCQNKAEFLGQTSRRREEEEEKEEETYDNRTKCCNKTMECK